jgi:hypothetical protein
LIASLVCKKILREEPLSTSLSWNTDIHTSGRPYQPIPNSAAQNELSQVLLSGI